ncbi:MAG: rhodanese-like domain-containing protein [Vicinamibacterales bacterium]
MPRWMSRLGLNQRLALAALVLGVVAIGASPYRGNLVRLDARELALIVKNEVDHVDAVEVAEWIIEGRSDFRLIDLRDSDSYAEYHIPGAEHVSIESLPDFGLGRHEKIVLYSDGGIHSAQGWFLLKAKGYRSVYIVSGGLDEWKNKVLFPALVEDPAPGRAAQNDKLKAIAAHFGGTPLTGAATAAGGTGRPSLAMPKLELPAGGLAPAKKAKKREGC